MLQSVHDAPESQWGEQRHFSYPNLPSQPQSVRGQGQQHGRLSVPSPGYGGTQLYRQASNQSNNSFELQQNYTGNRPASSTSASNDLSTGDPFTRFFQDHDGPFIPKAAFNGLGFSQVPQDFAFGNFRNARSEIDISDDGHPHLTTDSAYVSQSAATRSVVSANAHIESSALSDVFDPQIDPRLDDGRRHRVSDARSDARSEKVQRRRPKKASRRKCPYCHEASKCDSDFKYGLSTSPRTIANTKPENTCCATRRTSSAHFPAASGVREDSAPRMILTGTKRPFMA